MASEAQVREQSERIYEYLNSRDTTLFKQAEDELTDMTLERVRESEFTSKILTPKALTSDMLDRRRENDEPVVWIDFEPGSPGAVMVPYGETPQTFVPFGGQYPVVISEIETERFRKRLINLEAYKYDFRALISDNMTKDLVAYKDTVFMNMIDDILQGPDVVIPYAERPLYVDFSSPLTYEGLQYAKLSLINTPFRLRPVTCLCNLNTFTLMKAFAVAEFRGLQIANEIISRGHLESNFDNLNWIVTQKFEIVPDGALFMFPEEKFMGKHIEKQGPTMVVEKYGTEVVFWMYMQYGMTIGHSGSLNRNQFRGQNIFEYAG